MYRTIHVTSRTVRPLNCGSQCQQVSWSSNSRGKQVRQFCQRFSRFGDFFSEFWEFFQNFGISFLIYYLKQSIYRNGCPAVYWPVYQPHSSPRVKERLGYILVLCITHSSLQCCKTVRIVVSDKTQKIYVFLLFIGVGVYFKAEPRDSHFRKFRIWVLGSLNGI